jgi:hypothetical protein
MAKTLLSIHDLQARALAEIKRQPGCSDIRNIAINRVADERLPGGACTHWKAPPCHGARQYRKSKPSPRASKHEPVFQTSDRSNYLARKNPGERLKRDGPCRSERCILIILTLKAGPRSEGIMGTARIAFLNLDRRGAVPKPGRRESGQN